MRKNSEKEREALAKRRRGEIDAEDAADGGAGAPPSGVPDPKRLKVTPAVFQVRAASVFVVVGCWCVVVVVVCCYRGFS